MSILPSKEQGLIAWMASNPVAANLLMLLFVIGGLLAAGRITQEVFPSYALDIVTVSVRYPGASPEEVEEGVVLAVEEEIRALDNVERVTSVSMEGNASISVELLSGADPNSSLQEIKNGIDRISTFPGDVEKPLVSLATRRREVLRLALYGDIDEGSLFSLVETIRSELLDITEIAQVELNGTRDPELSIEISRDMLRAHNLSLEEVADTIKERAVDVPAGGIKSQGGEVLLRTSERREVASEFSDLVLVSREDGTKLILGEVAELHQGFEESDREAWYNGKRAALLYVYRTGDQTPIDISNAVHAYMDKRIPTLPPSVQLTAYRDRSELYKDRMELLLTNGVFGLCLVLLTLGLFLEPRLAFWVSMGVPISVIGSFLILYFIGGSLNMISMFAFIITLGIVVDDAVVVGENIFYKRRQGMEPLRASIEGAREMAAPVVIAVATNIFAFLPLLFVSGSTGRFFAIMPAVVIAVFLVSLIECLYVLPAHLSYRRKERKGKMFQLLEQVPRFCEQWLDRFVSGPFARILRWNLSFRYLVSALGLAVLIVAYSYWDSGHINFSFRPDIQTDSVDAEVELPYGVNMDEVKEITRLVEEGGKRAVEKSGDSEILVGIRTDIGRGGANRAEVSITLVPQEQRKITTREFSVLWKKEVGEIAGLEKLFFDYLMGPGGSAAINVELTHPDPQTLELAAADLAEAISQYSGVTDVNDGFARGKVQYDFKMLPEGKAVGLTAQDLGSQIRHAFYGAEALRQQQGRNELKVVVRLPRAERSSLFHLEQLLIRTPDGGEIPLERAARIIPSRAYTEINRVDGKRVLSVTANVVAGKSNENKILDSLKREYLPELLANYSGLNYSFQGQQREKRMAVHDLLMGIALMMPAIFCLLAILFRSYGQALLVMISIPFGLVSALFGHIIMGYSLSIISIFGMIALCGVVINGGLVFTVTANRYRGEGKTVAEAAFMAATRRFRPIILTSLTTFFGLAPMIFEQSVQARFLIPMAISLGYGILFSTAIILFLMPAFYLIYDDVLGLMRNRKS
ncbi:cation/multidrug efflux pump [Desulfocapsa sulfexigens DSM 10523]|uniref:Cation/multidrug efflux pump n=1 Tax=Desulfocapsa sulfexigens (strain DSM 10523 / SB164P1) TaxID=1167006 RepID=M1NDZ1_DESSD|nr:efflux RND transporter permease subunit [Desulfocapsa sulfexigens]AGF77924.1 cation/multidrug efflux pump [Desulfocapsa sulfexigens DSM 10523]